MYNMSVSRAYTTDISDGVKAILIWRNLEYTNKNINSIHNKDTQCVFRAFSKFDILRNQTNIQQYREKYTKKTKKDWHLATISDIFKADLVW